jgi:hypothetical protein
LKIPKGSNAPMTGSYSPELDMTDECDDAMARVYMSMIGILRWLVELSRIDIAVEVSMMSSYSMSPRIGHMEQILKIFAYLKLHHNSRLVLDPTYPDINEHDMSKKRNWNQFYGMTKEDVLGLIPRPLGEELIVQAFMDADFAGEKLTQRSRTGFVIVLNNAPIYWFTKKKVQLRQALLEANLWQ